MKTARRRRAVFNERLRSRTDVDTAFWYDDDEFTLADIFDDQATGAIPFNIDRRNRQAIVSIEVELLASKHFIPFFRIYLAVLFPEHDIWNSEVREHHLW